MTQQDKKLVTYNVHLARASITDPKALIAEDKENVGYFESKDDYLSNGLLAFQQTEPKPSKWRDLLQPAFEEQLPFRSQHASAVLIFKAYRRFFAVTFGYGKSLLNEANFESDFGLITALSLCDPSTIRAVDFRTIEERTRIGRFQSSDESIIDDFRLVTDTDLLRGIEATSADKKICEHIGAKWENLIISTRYDIKELPTLARILYKKYQQRNLPGDFDWIQNVRKVNSKSERDALDSELEKRIDSNKHKNIRLVCPEISGSTIGISARIFKSDGDVLPNSISDYINTRKKIPKSTLNALKDLHKVYLVNSSNGSTIKRLSVFQCVVAEIKLNGKLHLLADGEWFELSKKFVDDVNNYISNIPTLKNNLPKWKLNIGNGDKEPEGDWNARAVATWNRSILMDKKNISLGGGSNRFEVADIALALPSKKYLLHVKRTDKSSSGLSHLFAQGSVSSECIDQDGDVRDDIAQKHPALSRYISKNKFTSSDWTICYTLLGASDDRTKILDSIPFFSRVNLRLHAQRLRAMKFKVALIGIPSS